MILKHMDWATFGVVVQRRGMVLRTPLSLSFQFEWLMGKRGVDVLWGC